MDELSFREPELVGAYVAMELEGNDEAYANGTKTRAEYEAQRAALWASAERSGVVDETRHYLLQAVVRGGEQLRSKMIAAAMRDDPTLTREQAEAQWEQAAHQLGLGS